MKVHVLPLLFGAVLAAADLAPLSVRDGHFVDPDGTPHRFWGVNLISAFPEPDEADAFAGRLAGLGVNLVRPHHLLRPGKDWIWRAPVNSLALYETNSRDLDPEAWRRFDALNAALRKRGIRLALSLHFSRSFRPADADILDPGSEDAKAWAAAMKELNGWPWNKSIDPMKMLPAIDERALLLQKEFARNLLTHRNPATGLTYAEDPQVLTIEVLNESSSAYALVCGNQFPDYFERKLQSKWEAYAKEHGVADPGNHRSPATDDLRRLRARFYLSLDEAHFAAIRQCVRDLGCKAAMTYSNLWRGEDSLEMHARLGETIEEHAYVDTRVANQPAAWMDTVLPRTRLPDHPYILGEFGAAEGEANVRAQGYARTELMLSGAAYGAYHDLDGIVWFAYCHGDRNLARGGRGKTEGREPALGDMATDAMLLDHMAPCALLYRAGLVRPAGRVETLTAKLPADGVDYNRLMNGTAPAVPAGALSCQSARKVFATGDANGSPAAPEWAFGDAAATGVYLSDTGELARDTRRKQLTVLAPAAEAFSGECAEIPVRPFRHLDAGAFAGPDAVSGDVAFATVVVAAMDGKPLAESSRILVSRTSLNAEHVDSEQPALVRLRGLAAGTWTLRVNRPEAFAKSLEDFLGVKEFPLHAEGGVLSLPRGTWTQVELVR